MQSTAGLSRSNGSNSKSNVTTASTVSQARTGLTEHDYIGLSEVSSSSHASASLSSEYVEEHQSNGGSLGETELNLGLSLSYKRGNNKSNAAAATGVSASFGGSDKALACEEEYQMCSGDNKNNNPCGWSRGGFKQWVPQERAWQGARILTAQDLQGVAAPLPQDMDMAATSGFAFSNSGRAIMASAAASAVSAGTKRGPHESVESDTIHHTSAMPKEQAVGWPPIGQFRRRSKIPSNPRPSVDDQEECVQQTNKPVQNQKQGSSLYVKVNMDGVPIGRKVDLNVHESYETLAYALEEMFQRPANVNGQNAGQICIQRAHSVANEAKRSRLLDGSSDFVLTYEDKEGDWMLVGDVPWRMFVNTVKRLRIMKTTDANGLGPRCPEKLNRHKSKPV